MKIGNSLWTEISLLFSFIFIWSGCTYDNLQNPSGCNVQLEATVASTTDAACGSSNGSFSIKVSGGTAPYTYTLSDGTSQSNGEFNNLTAGNYTVTIQDAAGCSANLTAQINVQNGLSVDVATTSSGCGTSEGAITLNATGGTAPYSYDIDQGSYQGENSFTKLSKGPHTISVKDANGCEINLDVKLTTGIGYTETIKPIIQANCAVSGCHVSGGYRPDLSNYKTVNSYARNIKSDVNSGFMPPYGSGKKLTSNQIDQISCWVDDGALNN